MGEALLRVWLLSMQMLSNMLWGMARLSEHPGDQVMQVYRRDQEKILFEKARDKADTEQAVSNVLWALAVLDETDPVFAEKVCSTTLLSPPLLGLKRLSSPSHIMWHMPDFSLMCTASCRPDAAPRRQ